MPSKDQVLQSNGRDYFSNNKTEKTLYFLTEPKEIEIRSLGCITQVCRLKSQQQKEVVQVIEVSPVKEERERERKSLLLKKKKPQRPFTTGKD